MEKHHRRKLAVILHADVVGSTTLVQRDETLAHDRIQDSFRGFSETIKAYGGLTHELRGDALVAEFARASDAVCAALDFQHEHHESLLDLGDDIKPTIRIGISLGEVVLADNTVTGGGVVLAQRVEQLAEPGGICITAAIHEALPKHMPFDQEDFGERRLKGFDEGVRVYRVGLIPGESIPAPERRREVRFFSTTKGIVVAAAVIVLSIAAGVLFWFAPWEVREQPASVEHMAFPLPDKPSIAVMPFDNLSNDPEQDYFVDGLTEDIITELSRFSELFVISRTSTFTYKGKAVKVGQVAEELGVRYVLEGSVRKTGTQLLVTVQLIEATSGRNVWVERYDRPLEELQTLQGEVLQKIVSTVAERIRNVGRRIANRKRTTNLTAYEHVLKGRAVLEEYTKESNQLARMHFEEAIELDPNYSRAYQGLAATHVHDYLYGWSEDGDASLKRFRDLALKAIQLNDQDNRARNQLAWAYMHERRIDESVAEMEKAVKLNPNDAMVLANGGYALIYRGDFQKAVDQIQRAMRLNPFHPDYYYDALGWAYYFLKDYDAALHTTTRITKTNAGKHRLLAAIYVRLGQMENAQAHAKKVLELEPEFEVSTFAKTMPFKDPALLDFYLDGLRLAGLPE